MILSSSSKKFSQEDTTKAKGGDLGFIKDAPQFADIYEVVKQDLVGSVHIGVIETPSYNIVAKVEEEKDAGSEMQRDHTS